MTDSLATASILASVSDELANTVERAGAAVITIDARRPLARFPVLHSLARPLPSSTHRRRARSRSGR